MNMQDPLERCRQRLRGRQQRLTGQGATTETAVLVPLLRTPSGDLAVLFERRALTLRRQPGEVSFPGGHRDPTDADGRATAWREAGEELGVPPDTIEYVGALDVLVAWSGLIIYPFVGHVTRPETIAPNPAEVDQIIVIELERLLAARPAAYELTFIPKFASDFPFHLVPGGRNYPWHVPRVTQWFYEFDDVVIWGLTARILHDFIELVR